MKHIKIFYLLVTFFITAYSSKADSPLTSTNFHTGYLDVDIVVKAKNKGSINQKLAEFLSSNENTIDVKAAVINAIGWDINGTDNAEQYCKIIHKKSMKELDIDKLSADDLFCIGYLQALDDYFRPEKSIPYLEAAQKKNSTSFTINIIYTLAKAQELMDKGDWCKVWEITDKALKDRSLEMDMRESAKKVIVDYMKLYKC